MTLRSHALQMCTLFDQTVMSKFWQSRQDWDFQNHSNFLKTLEIQILFRDWDGHFQYGNPVYKTGPAIKTLNLKMSINVIKLEGITVTDTEIQTFKTLWYNLFF